MTPALNLPAPRLTPSTRSRIYALEAWDKLRSSIACAGFVCFIPLFGRPVTLPLSSLPRASSPRDAERYRGSAGNGCDTSSDNRHACRKPVLSLERQANQGTYGRAGGSAHDGDGSRVALVGVVV